MSALVVHTLHAPFDDGTDRLAPWTTPDRPVACRPNERRLDWRVGDRARLEVVERTRPPSGWPGMMVSVTADGRARVVVDNSKGAETMFVLSLQATLSAAGFEVELRKPSLYTVYDTAVHFVVEGVSVRVPEALARHEFEVVADAVRDAAVHRRSDRQRSRAVPIYRGETNHVLAWVDGLASDTV